MNTTKWAFLKSSGSCNLLQTLFVNWRQFSADYFSFNRKERIAVLGLALLVVLIILAPKSFPHKTTLTSISGNDTAWIAAAKKLETKESGQQDKRYSQYEDNDPSAYQYDRSKNNIYGEAKGELFYFDPNTLTTGGWKKLGLHDKTAMTIQNFLAKGGHFYKADDLKKIYGLHEDEFARLEPYIKIEKSNAENFPAKKNETYNPASVKMERYKIFDINMADTSSFIALPGIGSKLAGRIINFRNKLGGFYSVLQVGETFGLADSTFQKIKQYMKLENAAVKKININSATIDELKVHPYIKYSIANPIVAYRKEHGLFTKVEDIKKIMVVTDEVYNKIAPYFTTQ